MKNAAVRSSSCTSMGQRLVGRDEPPLRVSAPGAGRELRVPSLASYPGCRSGWSGEGTDALSRLRTLLRRSLRRARNSLILSKQLRYLAMESFRKVLQGFQRDRKSVV